MKTQFDQNIFYTKTKQFVEFNRPQLVRDLVNTLEIQCFLIVLKYYICEVLVNNLSNPITAEQESRCFKRKFVRSDSNILFSSSKSWKSSWNTRFWSTAVEIVYELVTWIYEMNFQFVAERNVILLFNCNVKRKGINSKGDLCYSFSNTLVF